MYNGLFSCKFDMCDNNDGFIIRNNFKWGKYQNNKTVVYPTDLIFSYFLLLTNHESLIAE